MVAKYGLHLSDLVARIVSPPALLWQPVDEDKETHQARLSFLQSGEVEPLDLGLPISNLDGLRVVLDIAEHAPSKGKATCFAKSIVALLW